MIRYEIWPPRPKGGQQVGAGPQGIRGVHYLDDHETGIEACCQTERSQHRNRAIVSDMIEYACASLGLPV